MTVKNDKKVLNVSVVVPCYNEENGAAVALKELYAVLEGSTFSFEIIAVDDGSEDKTSEILQSLDFPIRILHNSENRGYGASIKRGIRHAKGELIAITDADGTYPPFTLPDLISLTHSGEAHMAVAARVSDKNATPLIRRPAKWFLRAMASFVSGRKIPDINSGLRVFRKDLAEKLIGILPDGFSLTTTITLALLTNGYTVEYRTVDYLKRKGVSKIRPIRDTLLFIQLTLKIALYFAPLKVFVPFSFLLMVASLVWALFSYFILGRLADTSSLVLALGGLQMGAIGMLAEMIRYNFPVNRDGD